MRLMRVSVMGCAAPRRGSSRGGCWRRSSTCPGRQRHRPSCSRVCSLALAEIPGRGHGNIGTTLTLDMWTNALSSLPSNRAARYLHERVHPAVVHLQQGGCAHAGISDGGALRPAEAAAAEEAAEAVIHMSRASKASSQLFLASAGPDFAASARALVDDDAHGADGLAPTVIPSDLTLQAVEPGHRGLADLDVGQGSELVAGEHQRVF